MKVYKDAYNQIMYDTLRSYTDVLMYKEMTYKTLYKDLLNIKSIVDEWLSDVEHSMQMEDELSNENSISN